MHPLLDPFLSEQLMSEPLTCYAADFEIPQLRRCVFDLTSIDWSRSRGIAAGYDGYTWKIRIRGHNRPYALKLNRTQVLVNTMPPNESAKTMRYCNLMQAAVEDVESPPIMINPNPKSKSDALRNTYMFSQEGRQAGLPNANFEPMVITRIPRMRRCYGWVKINYSTLRTWPQKAQPHPWIDERLVRYVSPGKDHIAIIYEYIQETENGNDPKVVKEVTDFLWRAGFGYSVASLARNWKNGVLIDLSDIVHACGYQWHERWYGPREVDKVLRDDGIGLFNNRV
ncbi:uncharacterized protein F4812DRAFT_440881 [Daldinia caldariorum]|uniref:uncharacterized protein n=1 Tax=Daldinia caldariorum TaxID=326644 RepID=UPI00200850E5|nr:uncharacterized protein F4812DRAFT_440881 [Daldinia caldariorum]KAI1464902.1 hypothetical protein F4812DRAFT_440881 [Daldinia caldariorum]